VGNTPALSRSIGGGAELRRRGSTAQPSQPSEVIVEIGGAILARARTMPTARTRSPGRHFCAAKTCSTRDRTRARAVLPRAIVRWHPLDVAFSAGIEVSAPGGRAAPGWPPSGKRCQLHSAGTPLSLVVSSPSGSAAGRRASITVASMIWPPIASQPLARSIPSNRANNGSVFPAAPVARDRARSAWRREWGRATPARQTG
jgi:hypothetical protein